MAHDNPIFFVNPANEVTLTDLNGLQNGSALGDVTRNNNNTAEEVKIVKKMSCCRWRWNWFVNTLLIISIFVLIAILEFDIIKFRPIGFHCRDPKISHKYAGDTVPFTFLIVLTIIMPFIGIALVEALVLNQRTIYKDEKNETLKGMKQAWIWYGHFLFGLLLVIFVTEAGKSIVSEPRPHFLDTCKPDKAINCTSGYVTDFKCTNDQIPRYLVKDSFRSFPSGHSALGFYMSVYMILFFQARIPAGGFLIVPWLQCMFLFWAMVCALTRITDHRHHWWDVLAGSICGILIAFYMVKVPCENFYKHHLRSVKMEKSMNGGSSNGRHPSSRRLLSSTSSCGTPPDDRELREVQAT